MVKNSNRSLEILENVSGKTYSIYDHFYAILLVFFNLCPTTPLRYALFLRHRGKSLDTGIWVKFFWQIFRIKKPGKSLMQKKIQHFKDLACPILIKIDTKIHSGTLNMIKDENKNLGFWVSPRHLKPHFRASAPIVKLHPADLARCYGK